MARVVTHIVVKFPWWYRAYITSLAALAKAGFTIDAHDAAKHVVDHSKLTLR